MHEICRARSDEFSNLCRELKIKNGLDVSDTWRQILMQIPRVSLPIANAVMTMYPTFFDLMTAYRESKPGVGPVMLENVGIGSRRIGSNLSAKIYYHFATSDDPDRCYQRTSA